MEESSNLKKTGQRSLSRRAVLGAAALGAGALGLAAPGIASVLARRETTPIGETAYHSRSATLVVAASDAAPQSKLGADFVCDGTADDVEINTAIAALPDTGGIVQLTEGTFNLTSSILLRRAEELGGVGLSLFGAGWRATFLKRVSDFSAPVLVVGCPDTKPQHAWNAQVRDLYINAGGEEYDDADACGMKVYAVHSIFENIYVGNFAGHGIHVYGYSGAASVVNRWMNICLSNQDGDGSGHGQDNDIAGIYCWGDGGGWVFDQFFSKIQFQGMRTGFYGGIASSMIEQCFFDLQLDEAIHLRFAENDIIAGNFIGQFGEGGAYTGQGIVVEASEAIIIANNFIWPHANATRAIHCDGVGSGQQLRRIVIVNNIFDADSSTVSEGIKFTPNGATVEENVISGNVFQDSGFTTKITGDLGNVEIHHNQGYVTENSGSDALADAQSSKVVAHGLAAAPTSVTVAPRADPGSGGLWVSARDRIGFTVTRRATTGPLSFDWYATMREEA